MASWLAKSVPAGRGRGWAAPRLQQACWLACTTAKRAPETQLKQPSTAGVSMEMQHQGRTVVPRAAASPAGKGAAVGAHPSSLRGSVPNTSRLSPVGGGEQARGSRSAPSTGQHPQGCKSGALIDGATTAAPAEMPPDGTARQAARNGSRRSRLSRPSTAAARPRRPAPPTRAWPQSRTCRQAAPRLGDASQQGVG